MAITLEQARYGKPETRVVRVRRDGDRHEIKDLNVSVALGGDLADTYRHLVEAFADTYSFSLQQTLYAMGQRVLEHRPEVAEVRLSLPNKHQLPVNLSAFGLPNGNEVYVAADRPYGLIEGTVLRDDAPPAGEAW